MTDAPENILVRQLNKLVDDATAHARNIYVVGLDPSGAFRARRFRSRRGLRQVQSVASGAWYTLRADTILEERR